MAEIGRSWFRVYSRAWRRLLVLAMSANDAMERADRRWAAIGDGSLEAREASAEEGAEHQKSERWAGITVRGRA